MLWRANRPPSWAAMREYPPGMCDPLALCVVPEWPFGFGVQTVTEILAHRTMCFYTGVVDLVPDRTSPFVLETSHGNYNIFVDAGPVNIVAKYINHCCDPNCCTVEFVHTNVLMIAIVSLRSLKAGEFLGWDYGKKYGLSNVCQCRAASCSNRRGQDTSSWRRAGAYAVHF